MATTPDFAGISPLLPDQVVVLDWYTSVPYFTPSEDTPPFATLPSPDVQPQPDYPPFSEIPIGMLFTQVSYDPPQDPYLPFQNALDSSIFLPRAAITPSDDVCAVQWSDTNGLELSVVCPTQQPMGLPVVFQPLPTPVLVPSPFKVPQEVYGNRRRQWNFERSDPISFSVNGRPGINMRDALRRHFTGLDGRDDAVLQNAAGAISCRILFPGYPRNTSHQISTLGWSKNRTRICRSKLAYEVAKKLNQYLESMAKHPMNESTDRKWRIGEGFMHLENMYLVHLASVSKGSFQPEIWVANTPM